jgi:hypothetical protein
MIVKYFLLENGEKLAILTQSTVMYVCSQKKLLAPLFLRKKLFSLRISVNC